MTEERLHSLFLLYMDSPRRRAVLKESLSSKGDKYLLFGLEEYQAAGIAVRHNLETSRRSSRAVHVLSRLINRGLRAYGGIGGDFRSVIACRHEMNRSDIILSTVDPVGIPLALCKSKGLINRPALYTSVGFPERIPRFRTSRAETAYCEMFRKMDGFIGYGYEECCLLRTWLNKEDDFVHFVPFGVDVEYFSASAVSANTDIDLLTIGADPNRDFPLIFSLARARPEYNIEIVTSKNLMQEWDDIPRNIRVLCDIPLAHMKDRMEAAAVVALPLKENSYSGATTTLLQAMAMERPVLVSRVGAIREGYHLRDGYNCILVTPGNNEEFIRKTDLLLSDIALQKSLAGNACKTVRQNLTWKHYVNSMQSVLEHCYLEYTGRKR